MYDLISVGHISIDLFFQSESFTFKDNRFQLAVGGKYFCDYLYTSVGGGGANVAIGARKNGLRTAVFGTIGRNSFKSTILSELSDAHVSTHLCPIREDFMDISSILLTESGERSVIHYDSPQEHLLKNKELIRKLSNTKMLYLGNMPDTAVEERAFLLESADKNGILTILNLGVKDCRKPTKDIVNLLLPSRILILNTHEFADLIKENYDQIDFNKNVLKNEPLLAGKIVIVTDGAKGSYGYFNDQIFHQKAISPHKIKDTTGCGDGYTAGFIAEFLKTKNIKKSMHSGSSYAAEVLSRVGAN